MAEFPQLPIHVQRWLSELSDLTLEQHGVYFLTILQMWLQPDCGMPTDPEWLRKKLRVHPQKWLRLWPLIRSFMTEVEGRLYQKTLCEERQYLRDKREKGQRNANKRWQTFHANPLKSQNTAHATQYPKTDAPTPTPTPTKEKKDSFTLANGLKVPLVEANGHKSIRESGFDVFYAAYPKRVSRKQAEKAYQAALKTTTSEKIMAGLDRAKKNDRRFRELQYTPHPATWLNAAGYDDDESQKGFNWRDAIV